MSTKAEQAGATRTRLIEVARSLFAERGYAAVGTEEIVREAGVTRGALYHHFDDKRDLFLAVHMQIEAEGLQEIGRAVESAAGDDPLQAIKLAINSFLDSAVDPGRARITLIEAPSVLGWALWRELDLEHGLGMAEAALAAAMDAGRIRRLPVGPLASLFVAAFGEAAIAIATAEDPARMRVEMQESLLAIVDGLAL